MNSDVIFHQPDCTNLWVLSLCFQHTRMSQTSRSVTQPQMFKAAPLSLVLYRDTLVLTKCGDIQRLKFRYFVIVLRRCGSAAYWQQNGGYSVSLFSPGQK